MRNDYKAALLVGAKHIKIGYLAQPTLGRGEVLVRIQRANLCPTDLKKFFNLDEQSGRLLKEEGPVVLGHEAAGVIEQVGPATPEVHVGMSVAIDPMLPCGHCVYCQQGDFPLCLNLKGIGASAGSISSALSLLRDQGIGGCFAEYVKVPVANLYVIPDSLSLDAASLMEPLADVLHSLEVGAPQKDETVVVFGLGTMGLLHVRVLSAWGIQQVIGIDPNATRRAKAEAFGATLTVDPTQQDPVTFLNKNTGGLGPHLVFVCAGGIAQKVCTQQALQAIRKKGRVLLYASALAPAEIPVDINRIHYGLTMLTGTVGFYRRHAEQALQLLEHKVVDVQAIRTPTVPLDRIAEAFSFQARGDVVKVGVNLTSD